MALYQQTLPELDSLREPLALDGVRAGLHRFADEVRASLDPWDKAAIRQTDGLFDDLQRTMLAVDRLEMGLRGGSPERVQRDYQRLQEATSRLR